MADRIKGITIEIDGQTTGLKKALGDVTDQSIGIQKELTDVQRLLKFDPGNTEALAQKQELLSKQIDVTSQKLKTLKDAQSQVEQQFKSGNIGEDQYRAFQREIQFTEASLGKFKTAYQDALKPPKGDATAPLKGLQDEAEKTKGIFDNMGEYIKRGVGLAIGGDIWDKAKEGIGELITFGGDWQKSLNGIQSQTGATNEEMANFNQQIEDIYNNNFGSSVEDVADSFVQVRQYMQGTGEDLQDVTQNAIAFRDTFGVDIPESMRSVQSLMKQFGLTSEEAFNLLAQGQQQGLDYSGELLDSVNEYSPQFKKFGFDATDMFNVFKSGADAGAFNLDKVGDAVKELSIRVIDGSKTTQQGFEALGLNADEMAAKFGAGGDSAKEAFYQVIDGLKNIDDPVAQSATGVELFGTQWEDLGPQVVTSLGSVQNSFDKTKDSMEQINQVKYNTPIEAMQGLGREIETSVLLPVSQELMPSLNDIAKQLANAFSGSDVQSSIQNLSSSLGDFIKNIADSATTVLPKLLDSFGWILDNAGAIATGIIGIGIAFETFKAITVISGAITAIIPVITTISGAIAVVTTGAAAATPAIGALAAVFTFLTGPIGIAIVAITAIVAAITYLWNTNEGFRNAIIEAWQSVAKTANEVWNGIITFFTVTIPAALSSVGDFFSGLWQMISQSFTDGWNDIVVFFTQSIPAWIESVGTWFAELPNKIAYGLGEALGTIIKWGIDAWNYLNTNVPLWINSIGTWFSELPGNIKTWFDNTINNIKQWGIDTYTELSTSIANIISSVSAWFSALPGNITTWFNQTITDLTTWGSNMYNTASTEVSNVVNGIEKWFSELPNKMLAIGGNIVAGLKQGILDAWEGMTGWIGGLCDSFTKGVRKALDIHSPSRVMRQLGVYTGEGFGLGIGDTVSSISKQANAIADAATPNVNAGTYDMGINSNPIGRSNVSTGSSLDAILAKMDSMTNAIANMQILMDSKMVGKLVTPAVSGNLAFNNGRKGWE